MSDVTDPESTSVALPAGYHNLLAQVRLEVTASQVRATRAANSELLSLYWRIGRLILAQQEQQGWGTKVTARLSADLQASFPGSTGFSPSNLQYMRGFASAWPSDPISLRGVGKATADPAEAISQRAVGKLPWGHVHTLLDKLKDQDARDWYAMADAANGWSRAVLEHHIATDLRSRSRGAPSNFSEQLLPHDSDQITALLKDPYIFDFLNLADRASERTIEQGLMDRLQETLLELGKGFAFVGRQVRFDVDGDEFFVDILLFHTDLVRYVVVELKLGKFKPEYAGQLGFYVAMVDDKMRRPAVHAPTVGILLCSDRNEQVVRYALGQSTAPMAVSTYTYDALPPSEKAAMPPADAITAALTSTGSVVSGEDT